MFVQTLPLYFSTELLPDRMCAHVYMGVDNNTIIPNSQPTTNTYCIEHNNKSIHVLMVFGNAYIVSPHTVCSFLRSFYVIQMH